MGLIVDLFAGGGGASTGLAWALGRDPDIAINHDAEALAMHAANHPGTRHLLNDITRVLPLEATGGQPVDVLHASPDCTHFSKAKGGKPRSQYIRDLAWVVVRWAEDARPNLITLENVEEFQTWGPLNHSGQPIKARSGDTFRSWVRCLRRLGYTVDWRELRACDYGAPTTRKRLFVVARRDGKSIVWPEPTHGHPKSAGVLSGKLQPYRTAAECVDWSIPSQSIFNRKKPLVRNTQRRIAEGIRRYVLHAAEPFVVALNHTTRDGSYRCFRGQGIGKLLATITQSPGMALVTPVLSRQFGGSIGQGMDRPHPTITQSNHDMLVTAGMVKMRGTNVGSPVEEPLHTISAQGQPHALMSAHLCQHFGPSTGQPADAPLSTIVGKNKHSLATAHLIKYYGRGVGTGMDEPIHTVTGKDRMGLVTANLGGQGRYEEVRAFLRLWGVIGPDEEAEVIVDGLVYRIVDIFMRMLKPRELYRAQGFQDSYKITPMVNGKGISVTAQVRMCGNSVPPQFVAALVRANGPSTWATPRPRSFPMLDWLSQTQASRVPCLASA